MMCEACERDDHANCGMQTWCECDCDPEACDYFIPDGYYAVDDADYDVRLVRKPKVFTHCNVCGTKLREGDPEEMGMCERCAGE